MGFYTGNKIPSPKKTSWETSTDLVSNSGNELWQIFSKDAAFPAKVYSLSGCVNLRQRETPAPGNPDAALMSPVYLIHGNICRAWLSPHINIVFWVRVSAGTLPLEWHKYLLFKQLCSCILFFWSRGLCLVFWTCSATFSISDSSTSNLSLPDSPPFTLLAPQLWVTAAASAVHTKTSVVLRFFDYTDN